MAENPNIDKVVHICMYFGMSGNAVAEFLRAHRRDNAPLWHAWAACCGLLSGMVVAARILHDIPWRRLAGFCGQYHGSGACIDGRLFYFKAKDEIGL